jgi:hypothetical protein
MFDNMTKEQREAWARKVHSVDAALKSAVEPHPVREEAPKPQHHVLHLVPKLHLPHHTQGGKTMAA